MNLRPCQLVLSEAFALIAALRGTKTALGAYKTYEIIYALLEHCPDDLHIASLCPYVVDYGVASIESFGVMFYGFERQPGLRVKHPGGIRT